MTTEQSVRVLATALWSIAAALAVGLGAWAVHYPPAVIIGGMLLGAALAIDLAHHLPRRPAHPPVGQGPASSNPAGQGPASSNPVGQGSALPPLIHAGVAQPPGTSNVCVLILRRGPHRFVFSAPQGREVELECALADAVTAGWLDCYDAALLTQQIPGALPT